MFYSREQEALELQRRVEESGKRLLESLAWLDRPVSEPERAKPRVMLISSNIFERISLEQSLSHDYSIIIEEDINALSSHLPEGQPYAILIDAERKDDIEGVAIIEALNHIT